MLAPFAAERIVAREDGGLRMSASLGGKPFALAVDRIVVATGFRPDFSFLRRIARRARSGGRSAAGARAADRPELPFLRHRAAAWHRRARPSRTRLRHRRLEILWPRADLPDGDRLRAGPLGRGRDGRRPRGGARRCSWCCRRPACAAPTTSPRPVARGRRRRLLRRTGARRGRRLLRGGCRGEGRGQVGMRLRRRRARPQPGLVEASANERCSKVPAAAVWALGLTQIVGYGTLFYSFSILAPAMAGDLGCRSNGCSPPFGVAASRRPACADRRALGRQVRRRPR